MPFTPLHMGPAMAFKWIGKDHFSLVGFGVTQIVLDIEPLVAMLRGTGVLHGWSHTWLGATVLGAGVALLGGPVCRRLLGIGRKLADREGMTWLQWPPLRRHALVSGALVGAWSHVALDSVMHHDLHPFSPWSQAQPWLHALGPDALNLGCIGLGVVLTVAWLWRDYRRWTSATPPPDARP